MFEVGKRYTIYYDDKGKYPVIKRGKIVAITFPMLQMESGELLNVRYVVRSTQDDK